MTAAFSRDMGSAGRYSFFHYAIMASVVRTFRGSIFSVNGILLFSISGSQMSFHSYLLNREEKAPIYDTKALASNASPITDLMFSDKSFTFYFQRLFSPARPLTNFSAAFNLASQASASASTRAF